MRDASGQGGRTERLVSEFHEYRSSHRSVPTVEVDSRTHIASDGAGSGNSGQALAGANLRLHVPPLLGDRPRAAIRASETQSCVRGRAEVPVPRTVELVYLPRRDPARGGYRPAHHPEPRRRDEAADGGGDTCRATGRRGRRLPTASMPRRNLPDFAGRRPRSRSPGFREFTAGVPSVSGADGCRDMATDEDLCWRRADL